MLLCIELREFVVLIKVISDNFVQSLQVLRYFKLAWIACLNMCGWILMMLK